MYDKIHYNKKKKKKKKTVTEKIYIYFCFIDYTKAFDCMDHKKQWKILKEMGIQMAAQLNSAKSSEKS